MQIQHLPYVHTNTIHLQGSAELVASNDAAHHVKKAITPFVGTAVGITEGYTATICCCQWCEMLHINIPSELLE